MTQHITIHEHAPSDLTPDQNRRLTSTICSDIHSFIRRREAEGVKELWTWRIETGETVAAYFYEEKS